VEVVRLEGLQTVLLGVHFEDVGHEHSEGVNVAGVGSFLFLEFGCGEGEVGVQLYLVGIKVLFGG